MANLIDEKNINRINLKNLSDLKSVSIERKFGRPEDYIEVSILDLNNRLLSYIPNLTSYSTKNNQKGLTDEIDINPLQILQDRGYATGKYKLAVNIQKRKIFNVITPVFRIFEISPSRTELKLNTNFQGNLDQNSSNFIRTIKNSKYFRDFNLNFQNNRNIVAVNIDIDKSDPNQFLLLIKLLEPLPGDLGKGDLCNIVEDIIEPIEITYDLGTAPPIDTSSPLKGPNFEANKRLNAKVPLKYKSYNDILDTNLTSSYQKLISKLDGYEVAEIDYSYIRPSTTASLDFERITPSHFENFIHFGSATEQLKNFKYKLQLIESYDQQLKDIESITGTTSSSIEITEATSSIITKKENLIQGFSGYEQFLYFTSGSLFTWPKTTTTEPYLLSHTTSSQSETWLGSNNDKASNYGGQLLSASIFDVQNPNSLSKLIPTFIGDKEENEPFLKFCDMVGQQFDPIWTHIKELTQIRNNHHTLGVSKNLVLYALQTLGLDAFDQFQDENLFDYVFGQTLTPTDGSTVITGSNEVVSKDDITKEIYKRLYHNASYLLKTKGTERGLRALINCYGIPETVLDIKEFAGSDPNRDDSKLYTYPKFTQVITGDSKNDTDKSGFFIETLWSSSLTETLINDITASGITNSPKTIEFRVKPLRSDSQYHLFSLTNHSSSISSGSDLHLVLHPYTGSSDFFVQNDRTNYGKLEIIQFTSSIASSSGLNLNGASSPYFPIYNGNFWDLFLSTEGVSGSSVTCSFGAYQTNHLREVSSFTREFYLTEEDNAKSFGNPYYSNGQYIGGVKNAYFGGIRNVILNGNTTSSYYTVANTSSFELGYSGSFSEIRYYFGELLSDATLKQHALEPLMYAGNSISSSFNHLVLRYPLSFELDLDHDSSSQIPSASAAWNANPTSTGLLSPGGLTGPITGGAILSSSLNVNQTGSGAAASSSNNLGVSANYPIVSYSGQYFPSGSVPLGSSGAPVFTIGGTPLLQSHHPNIDKDYLQGFTYFDSEDIELLVETHHIPTPNAIGRSFSNKKIRIHSGSTDSDLLSPDILVQNPSSEQSPPDFSNIGIYLSPQNEITEDIIYTLGTFNLDESLGDPRESKDNKYADFEILRNHYFKKLKLTTLVRQKYNLFDFTRWVQFLDHTLFEVIKNSFTPQKSIDKTGVLIEPHVLERNKFKRYNPITSEAGTRGTPSSTKLSSSLFETTIKETTASFSKNNNLDIREPSQSLTDAQQSASYGSTVLTHFNFLGTGSDGRELQLGGTNTNMFITKAFTGSTSYTDGINQNGQSQYRTRYSQRAGVLYGNFTEQPFSIKRKIEQSRLCKDKDLILANSEDNNFKALFSSSHSTVVVGDNNIQFSAAPAYQKAVIGLGNYEPKRGKTYEVSFTISGYSGTGDLYFVITTDEPGTTSYLEGFGGNVNANGNYVRRITIDGSSENTSATFDNKFYLQSNDGSNNLTCNVANLVLKEIGPVRDVEFNDSLLSLKGWSRPRYEGSRLTGAEINKYTQGDITYGLNPVLEQPTTAIYFGKSFIGADGEDDALTTIKNHSYIGIEKVLLINKYTDEVTPVDVKTRDFNALNGYVADDFKDGSSFSIRLLDNRITHKLKKSYQAKFNQGYLYNILKYKGGQAGTDSSTGEGLLIGHIVSSSEGLAGSSSYSSSDGTQNVFVYGYSGSSMSSDNLQVYSNTFTREIWPDEMNFGLVGFSTASQQYVYSNMSTLGSFVNSMLVPIASESQYRLFGTFNLGQEVLPADYSSKTDSGIKSISTVEFDLSKYQVSSSGTKAIHTLFSASSTLSGFGRDVLQPHSYMIPIMKGPHDVITTPKSNSGITWPANDAASHAGHGASSNGQVQLMHYFYGNNAYNSVYQISYLEKDQVIIANVNKKEELYNDIGDEGYVLIPNDIDKDIKNNLEYFLVKAGLIDSTSPPRIPNEKE